MAGFNESIKVTFGGDASKLRAVIGEANALVDGFDKGVKKLGLDLGKGAGFGIFVGMLRRIGMEGIEAAQKTREEFEKLGRPIDTATKHAAEFGDALDAISAKAIRGAQHVISVFTHIGNYYGELWMNIAKLSGTDQFDNADRNRAISQEAERNIKNIGKAREETLNKEASASERRAKAERQLMMESLSDAERRNVLMRENAELAEWVRTTGEGSLNGDKARAALAENVLEINKLDKKITEEKGREKEKADRASEKAEQERVKILEESLDIAQDQADFDREGLTLQEQVNSLKKEEAEINNALKDESLEVKDINALTSRLLEVQVELRKKSKDLAVETAKADKEAAEELERQAKLTRLRAQISEDFMNSMFGFRDDRDYQGASDAELGELVRRSKQGLLNMQANNPNEWERSDFDRVRLSRQMSLAEGELRTRNNFRNLVDMRGVEGARMAFQGDPLSFDRLLEQFTRGLDVNDRILRETERTNELLAGKFVNQ